MEPRCGKFMKCPVPSSRYSFSEQRKFDVINWNLFRRDGIFATSVLPRNDKVAFQNMLNLERVFEIGQRFLSTDRQHGGERCYDNSV